MIRKVIAGLMMLFLSGCDNQERTDGGGVAIHDCTGNTATVYIVEKDGFKFAVAMSGRGVGICQIIENSKVERK